MYPMGCRVSRTEGHADNLRVLGPSEMFEKRSRPELLSETAFAKQSRWFLANSAGLQPRLGETWGGQRMNVEGLSVSEQIL